MLHLLVGLLLLLSWQTYVTALLHNKFHNQVTSSLPTRRRILHSDPPLSRLRMNFPSTVADNSDERNKNKNSQGMNGNQTALLVQEAKLLQEKAQEIMKEVGVMERDMKTQQSNRQHTQERENDDKIETLFFSSSQNATAQTVADIWISETWSMMQIEGVLDRLVDLQTHAMGQTVSFSSSNQRAIASSVQPMLNSTEHERLSNALDILMEAAAVIDKNYETNKLDGGNSNRWNGRLQSELQARLSELQRIRQLAMDRQLAGDIQEVLHRNISMEEFFSRAMARTTGGKESAPKKQQTTEASSTATSTANTNQTEQVALVPLWVPKSFLRFLISTEKSTLGPDQVTALQEKVLAGSRFFVTSTESVPGAALFRGNLRTSEGSVELNMTTNHTAIVFREIQDRLQKTQLRDKVQLFFLPDPEWQVDSDMGPEAMPVVLALSKSIHPDESQMKKSVLRKAIKELTYPLAIFTSFTYTTYQLGLNKKFFEAVVVHRDATALRPCLPMMGGIFAIQLLHEIAHWVTARRKEIKIGIPVPLPSLHLGLAGCITPIRSFPKTRAALFDFALAGPLTALTASLGCITTGIWLTVRATPSQIAFFPVLRAEVLQSSFLVGTILSVMASKILMLPAAQPVPIHPLFVIGFSGLLSSALHLLPMFRLDGGRASYAVVGPRSGVLISVYTLLMMLSFQLTARTGLATYWLLMTLFFQGRQEVSARDQVTKVGKTRTRIWLASLLCSIAVLAPFPGGNGLW